MKKLLLFLFLTFSLAIPAQANFTDLDTSSPYYNSITELSSQKVVNGYQDGSFLPGKVINRAEFLKIAILARVGDDFKVPENLNCFNDVTTNDWFAPTICYAKEQKWIQGYAGNLFKSANFINFGEAFIMISNIFNLNTDPYQNPEWYYPAQRYFDAQQLIPNIEQSIDFQVNRGEMSEMIWQTQQHMDFLTKTNPSADYFSVPYEKERIDVFNAVNQERQNNGREKLLYSMQLEKAAQIHAEAMMRAGDIFHRDPATGQTAAERVKYFQYDQRYFGENVAKGQANATEAMVSWINSPPHYENIMQADAREIGVGISANPQGELFWVQVFGRQCEERDYLIGCTTRSDFQERNPGEYVSPFSWY